MRILLAAPTSPLDTSFGAAQRTTLMYRALAQYAEVDTVVVTTGRSFAAAPPGSATEFARLTIRAAPWHAKYTPNPEIRQWARANLVAHHYDLIVARELSTAGAFCEALDVPLIADADDAHYRYAPSRDSSIARLVATAKTHARARATRRALRRFSHVWFASSRDQCVFAPVASTVLPNVAPDIGAETQQDRASTTILFVGALWYRPNIEAVDWFISRCWPAVTRAVSKARLLIVGAGPVHQRDRWNRQPDVDCPGFVDDLASVYRLAAFTIAPIHYGGGTQIKTLESLAYGRPAVVSRFVADGYANALADGQSLAVADSAPDMIEKCVGLLRDPDAASRMGRAGREVVKRQFGWSAFAAGVAHGISQIDDRWTLQR